MNGRSFRRLVIVDPFAGAGTTEGTVRAQGNKNARQIQVTPVRRDMDRAPMTFTATQRMELATLGATTTTHHDRWRRCPAAARSRDEGVFSLNDIGQALGLADRSCGVWLSLGRFKLAAEVSPDLRCVIGCA